VAGGAPRRAARVNFLPCFECGSFDTVATLEFHRGRESRAVRVCSVHVSHFTWSVEALARLRLHVIGTLRARAPRVGPVRRRRLD
jgi:hypothetical protein